MLQSKLFVFHVYKMRRLSYDIFLIYQNYVVGLYHKIVLYSTAQHPLLHPKLYFVFQIKTWIEVKIVVLGTY